MKNQYFNIYRIINKSDDNIFDEFVSTVRIRYEEDICAKFWEDLNNDVRNKYLIDIKGFIKEMFPDVYNTIYDINKRFNKVDINEDQYVIYEGTVNDYRKIDKEFDNECKLVETLMNEKTNDEKNKDITEEILINAGFEYLKDESKIRKDYEKDTYGINNYKVFYKFTNDLIPLKLDIDNGWTNRFGDKGWHLHIDNDHCETIGSVDIQNVWEFNTLMQIFGSKFKL